MRYKVRPPSEDWFGKLIIELELLSEKLSVNQGFSFSLFSHCCLLWFPVLKSDQILKVKEGERKTQEGREMEGIG